MERIVNLVLSDLHIGNKTLRRRTGGLTYDKKQQRRRLAHVVRECCEFKRDHRKEQALRLWILGDLGRGEIHAGGDRMSEQISYQVALLGAAVRKLDTAYDGRVAINCVTGNHGRFVVKHPTRAVDDKADSYETIVYQTLTQFCKRVSIPETAYVSDRLFGHRFLASHGDTMFYLPNPGGSINIARIEQKINRWSASRWKPDVVILGHHHTPTIQGLPAGNVLVINGSLCPADEYCVSMDIPNTPSCQVMFESTPDYAVGDMRWIWCRARQDNDSSLDKVLT